MNEEKDIDRNNQSSGSASEQEADESLMVRVMSGSQEAFEIILNRYSSHIINFAYRFLSSQEEAEDIAQQVFLRAYKASSRYDPKRPFRPWLFSIASRLISNQIRFRKRHRNESLDVTPQETEGGSYADKIPDPSCLKPEDILEKQHLIQQVQGALQRLPESQRIAVLLARFEDMSYEEIGHSMGISVSSVKSLLFRARERLRYLLKH